MSEFFSSLKRPSDFEVVVEMPMRLHGVYGVFFTSRACDDDILRIRRGDEDVVLLHPDGRIEVLGEVDRDALDERT